MTIPKTSIQSVNLDDLEREMRRIAVSRRSVGRAKLTRTGGRPVLVAPVPLNRDHNEPPAESGPASDAIPPDLERGSFGSNPHTPSVAVPRRPLERRSRPSSRALALVVLCVLIATGVGVAAMMRVGPCRIGN